MRRAPSYAFATAASTTSIITGVMSTPMPSPSMNGMIGLSGTGSPGTILAPPSGTRMEVVVLISHPESYRHRHGDCGANRGGAGGGLRPPLPAISHHERPGEGAVRRGRLGRRPAGRQGTDPLLRRTRRRVRRPPERGAL